MKKKLAGECSALFQTLPDRLEELARSGANKEEVNRHLTIVRDNILAGGEESLASTAKFMQQNVFARGFDIVNEWRLNSMLLSGKTQSISVIGANVMSWVSTLEEGLGAISGKWLAKLDPKDATRLSNQARAQAGELFNHQRKLKDWAKAYSGKNGSHIWGSDSKIEATMAQSAAGRQALMLLNSGRDDLLTSSLSVLGKVNQFAGNLLNRGDTHSKLIMGRAKHVGMMYAKHIDAGMDPDLAMRTAVDQADRILAMRATTKQNLQTAFALKRHGQELPEELTKLLDDLNITREGDIESTLDALDAGRVAGQDITFTGDIRRATDNPADLQPNQIDIGGRVIQGWTSNSSIMRFIVPFVKTPTNIASATWERTMGMALGSAETMIRRFRGNSGDLGTAIFNFTKRLESADPAVRAKAAGELTLAVPVAAGVVFLANTKDPDSGLPKITGTGPLDHRTRKMWEQAGWQKRSIMVNGNYVSYDRLDPVAGAMFGFMADMVDAVNFSSDDDVLEAAGDISMGLVAAIASNITSKTWMTGVRQAVDIAFADSDHKVEMAFRSGVGSFVPSVGRDVAQLHDRELKDISSLQDSILAKVPYMSTKVDVRRNFMGEEVSYQDSPGGKIWNTLLPFNVSKVRDGVLADEFASFQQGISMPSVKTSGIDLKAEAYEVDNRSAYDRFLERSATTKIGGRTLRQALRQLVKSDKYQRLDTEDIEGESNPRVEAVKAVVNRYRKKARNQIINETPALKRDINDRKQARKRRRQGLNFNFYQQ